MKKSRILRLLIGFIIGAGIGFLIRYFRGVQLAPAIGAVAGFLIAFKNKN